MLRSEANDINTNTAATLVCNIKGEAKQINKCITIYTWMHTDKPMCPLTAGQGFCEVSDENLTLKEK